jgi:hypothetical protein
MSLNEDNYDEINAELLEINARIREEEESNGTTTKRILVGSGEDCTIVLFKDNYRELHPD